MKVQKDRITWRRSVWFMFQLELSLLELPPLEGPKGQLTVVVSGDEKLTRSVMLNPS
jgi:hypothetical protein